MDNYGKELILDLYNCNVDKFTRKDLKQYFIQLCKVIDMKRCKLCFWDYKGEEEEYEKAPDHLKGTSAIQFISTSNITVHALDVLQRVYINIFSCKDFDENIAIEFSENWFGGETKNKTCVERI